MTRLKSEYDWYRCPRCGYETPATNLCRDCTKEQEELAIVPSDFRGVMMGKIGKFQNRRQVVLPLSNKKNQRIAWDTAKLAELQSKYPNLFKTEETKAQ